jgi:hypothetical protein
MTAKKDRKQQRHAKKRKAQRASQPSGQQILLQRAQTSDYLKDAQIVVNSGETEKMSEVILFANNTRVILDYHITQAGDRLDLNVVSTLEKDDNPGT